MGLPYWGIDNKATSDTAVITARTASVIYAAANLTKNKIFPSYRSADRAIVFDGTYGINKADNASLSLQSDATWEVILTTGSDVSTLQVLIAKWGGVGERSYRVAILSSKFELRLTDDGTTSTTVTADTSIAASTAYKIIFNYVASTNTVTASINSITSSVTVTGASVPGAIDDGNANFAIGESSNGGDEFTGEISHVVVVNAAIGGLGYTDTDNANVVGWWTFDDDDLTDSSGNSNTLTETSGTAAFTDYTSYQWLQLTVSAAISPDYFIGSKTHNLTTGAVVQVWSGAATNASRLLRGSATVTVGESIVISLSAGSNTSLTVDILDPDNTAGYIELPYIYMGETINMVRSFSQEYGFNAPRKALTVPDSAGGKTVYSLTDPLYHKSLAFPYSKAADTVTLQSVLNIASQGIPVVWCEDIDNEDTLTYIVYVDNANETTFRHKYETVSGLEMSLTEVGAGQ